MDTYSQSSVHHRPLSPAMAAGSCWDQQETCQMVNRIANIQASHDHPPQSWKGALRYRPPLYSPFTHVKYGLSYLQPSTAVDTSSGLHQSLKAGYSKDKDSVRYITNWWQRQPLYISTSSCYEIELYTTQTQLINTSEHVFLSCIGLGWISFMIIMMHLMLDILGFISHTRRLQESGLNLVRKSKTTSDLALPVNRTRILPIDVMDFQNPSQNVAHRHYRFCWSFPAFWII